MSKAMIWLTTGGFKVIEPEKAVEVWNALNGITEPSESQAEFLTKVRDVFIPPSYRPQAVGYAAAHKVPDGTKQNPEAVTAPQNVPDDPDRLHAGVEQGKNFALPENDR